MKKEFENWMVRKENKAPSTAYQYVLSIDKISKHYSDATKLEIDLYKENDLNSLTKIAANYFRGGKFSNFGDYGNGTIRNAIATYIRFIESSQIGQEIGSSANNQLTENDNIDQDDQIVSNVTNFTYERDLQNALIRQTEVLFPGYNIFGTNRDGIEFLIEGKRIDLLLENKNENTLLAIELKAGGADFRAFGQMSMYLGLLSEKFTEKSIKGLIIAGEIDPSLKYACKTNVNISLRTYKMELCLEEI